MLKDNHGRDINYLRLAVTDRCNLRCFYCMPEYGINWRPKDEILTYEEMYRLCFLLMKLGIEKIRITGGEPFVRKDIMHFLSSLSKLDDLQIAITTNGVLTAPHVPELKRLGIRSVNLSLDTLDRQRFFEITNRDELPGVLETLNAMLVHDFDIKLNAVVMGGKNTADIIPLVELTKTLPISVRFIEEMPFNGGSAVHEESLQWNYIRILNTIREKFSSLQKTEAAPYSTSTNYHIPGHRGTIGIIAAYSRTFCGTCNRLRITPEGMLKTCLYDDGVLNLKELMRNGTDDNDLANALMKATNSRVKDGWEAEQRRNIKSAAHESMAMIGG